MLQEEEVIAIDDTHSVKARPQRPLLKVGNNRRRSIVDVPL
jgi:hypothetical protein